MSGGGWGTRGAAPTLASQHAAAKLGEQVMEQGAMRANDLPQSYPYAPYAPDKRDTDMAMKQELLERTGIQGTLVYGPEDIAYLKSKLEQQEEAEKYLWVRNLFDLTNPAIRKYVREILPDFHKLEQDYFNQSMSTVERWTKINMMGITDKSDIEWLWQVKTGRFHVPAGFTPDQLMTPLVQAGGPNEDYTVKGRGIFNPNRFLARTNLQPGQGYARGNQVNPFAGADSYNGARTPQSQMVYSAPQFPGLRNPGAGWDPQYTYPLSRRDVGVPDYVAPGIGGAPGVPYTAAQRAAAIRANEGAVDRNFTRGGSGARAPLGW